MTKEQSVTTKIMKAFPNEKISLQPNVLEENLYFTEDKLAIEIDEKGHTDRPKKKEEEREKKNKIIKEYLGCKIIRINPDVNDFDIFIETGKMHNHIIESTKRYLIDKILNQSV